MNSEIGRKPLYGLSQVVYNFPNTVKLLADYQEALDALAGI